MSFRPTPLHIVLLLAGVVIASGCARRSQEVIDLNRVLAIFDQTLKSETEKSVDPAEGPDADKPEQPEITQEILSKFATNLNAAHLISSHIGVELDQSGAIQGFTDTNKSSRRDSYEQILFRIELDAKGNRIIASQQVAGQTYRRDHYYHGGYGRYYYYHHMNRAMRDRQDRYYGSDTSTGTSGRTKPNYDTMTMSPSGYHTQATSRARASSSGYSSSSARGYGGSRSFSGGK